MIKNQKFNLEKIKELMSLIDELQGKLFSLENNYQHFKSTQNIFSQAQIENISMDNFKELTQKLNQIYNKLIKISNQNLSKFLILQDNLINNYKVLFKEQVKTLKLDQLDLTNTIGKSLIENKKINKIIEKSSFIYTITLENWSDLLDSLKRNSLFLSTIRNVENFFKSLTDGLEEIPKGIDSIKESDYERETRVISSKRKTSLVSMRDYLKYTPEELRRRERRKKREKLQDLQSKSAENIEINQDIFEKIENYKAKLESSFKEKYLIQKDEDTDPLDLIRERKKNKEEEYKLYVKKLKKKEKE